jgi:hypothetical protein
MALKEQALPLLLLVVLVVLWHAMHFVGTSTTMGPPLQPTGGVRAVERRCGGSGAASSWLAADVAAWLECEGAPLSKYAAAAVRSGANGMRFFALRRSEDGDAAVLRHLLGVEEAHLPRMFDAIERLAPVGHCARSAAPLSPRPAIQAIATATNTLQEKHCGSRSVTIGGVPARAN